MGDAVSRVFASIKSGLAGPPVVTRVPEPPMPREQPGAKELLSRITNQPGVYIDTANYPFDAYLSTPEPLRNEILSNVKRNWPTVIEPSWQYKNRPDQDQLKKYFVSDAGMYITDDFVEIPAPRNRIEAGKEKNLFDYSHIYRVPISAEHYKNIDTIKNRLIPRNEFAEILRQNPNMREFFVKAVKTIDRYDFELPDNHEEIDKLVRYIPEIPWIYVNYGGKRLLIPSIEPHLFEHLSVVRPNIETFGKSKHDPGIWMLGKMMLVANKMHPVYVDALFDEKTQKIFKLHEEEENRDIVAKQSFIDFVDRGLRSGTPWGRQRTFDNKISLFNYELMRRGHNLSHYDTSDMCPALYFFAHAAVGMRQLQIAISDSPDTDIKSKYIRKVNELNLDYLNDIHEKAVSFKWVRDTGTGYFVPLNNKIVSTHLQGTDPLIAASTDREYHDLFDLTCAVNLLPEYIAEDLLKPDGIFAEMRKLGKLDKGALEEFLSRASINVKLYTNKNYLSVAELMAGDNKTKLAGKLESFAGKRLPADYDRPRPMPAIVGHVLKSLPMSQRQDFMNSLFLVSTNPTIWSGWYLDASTGEWKLDNNHPIVESEVEKINNFPPRARDTIVSFWPGSARDLVVTSRYNADLINLKLSRKLSTSIVSGIALAPLVLLRVPKYLSMLNSATDKAYKSFEAAINAFIAKHNLQGAATAGFIGTEFGLWWMLGEITDYPFAVATEALGYPIESWLGAVDAAKIIDEHYDEYIKAYSLRRHPFKDPRQIESEARRLGRP